MLYFYLVFILTNTAILHYHYFSSQKTLYNLIFPCNIIILEPNVGNTNLLKGESKHTVYDRGMSRCLDNAYPFGQPATKLMRRPHKMKIRGKYDSMKSYRGNFVFDSQFLDHFHIQSKSFFSLILSSSQYFKYSSFNYIYFLKKMIRFFNNKNIFN